MERFVRSLALIPYILPACYLSPCSGFLFLGLDRMGWGWGFRSFWGVGRRGLVDSWGGGKACGGDGCGFWNEKEFISCFTRLLARSCCCPWLQDVFEGIPATEPGVRCGSFWSERL